MWVNSFQNLRVCSDATVQKNATHGAGGRIFAAYDLTYNLSFLGGLLVGLSATPQAGLVAVLASSCFMFGAGSMIFSLMNRVETPDALAQSTSDGVHVSHVI